MSRVVFKTQFVEPKNNLFLQLMIFYVHWGNSWFPPNIYYFYSLPGAAAIARAV